MLYHFNENNIVTGYIKELLHNFNLPTCEVYKEGITEVYSKTNYIYNNSIILTNDNIPNNTYTLKNNYKFVESYIFGQKSLNITKNLKLNSILYDTYTHEYLGEYLRFYRDFTGIDLMMLYNCFSDNLVNNLYYHYNPTAGTGFNTQDSNYKVYMIPVKFNKKYLIGIDSDKPIELACGLYKNNNQITSINTDSLYEETYKLLTSMRFNNPSEYSTAVTVDADLKSFEPCLKLFIKLPLQNTSSISIIEVDGSSSQYKSNVDGNVPDKILPMGTISIDYPSKLSLFKINDGISYPFANRLLEYLFGQAIASDEQIGQNIERVQDQLMSPEQYYKNGVRLNNLKYYGVWDDNIRQIVYKATANKNKSAEFQYTKLVSDGNNLIINGIPSEDLIDVESSTNANNVNYWTTNRSSIIAGVDVPTIYWTITPQEYFHTTWLAGRTNATNKSVSVMKVWKFNNISYTQGNFISDFNNNQKIKISCDARVEQDIVLLLQLYCVNTHTSQAENHSITILCNCPGDDQWHTYSGIIETPENFTTYLEDSNYVFVHWGFRQIANTGDLTQDNNCYMRNLKLENMITVDSNGTRSFNSSVYDITGYIDKDVESLITVIPE